MNESDLTYIYIGLLKNCDLGLVEVSQEETNYRRIEMTLTLMDWNLLDDDIITNAVKVIFPQALKEWGFITHFGIFDSQGQLIIVSDLAHKGRISKDMQVQFDIGSLRIALAALGICND